MKLKTDERKLIVRVSLRDSDAIARLADHFDCDICAIEDFDRFVRKPVWAMALLIGDWTVDMHQTLVDIQSRQEAVPGLLIGVDENDLNRLVDSWFFASSCSPPTRPEILDFGVEHDFIETNSAPGVSVVGRQIEMSALQAKLARPLDLLRLSTHGDGLDVSLGDAGVLCGLGGRQRTRQLPCEANNYCHRLNLGLDTALADARLLDPTDINARVVILDTCSGLLISDQYTDARRGLAARFCQGARPVTVITHVGITFGLPTSDEYLLRQLRRGVSVAMAVGRYNRSIYARSLGRQYIVIGYSDTRITVEYELHSKRDAILEQGDRNSIPTSLLFHLSWLDQCLQAGSSLAATFGVDDGSQGQARAAIAAASRSVELMEGPCDPELEVSVRTAILGFIPRLGRSALTDLWEKFARIRRSDVRTCPYCTGHTSIYMATIGPDSARRVQICVACGIIEDCPAYWDTQKLVIHDGKLCGKTFQTDGEARVVSVHSGDMRPGDILRGNREFGDVMLPEGASGVHQIGLWVMKDFEIGVFYARAFRDEIGNWEIF